MHSRATIDGQPCHELEYFIDENGELKLFGITDHKDGHGISTREFHHLDIRFSDDRFNYYSKLLYFRYNIRVCVYTMESVSTWVTIVYANNKYDKKDFKDKNRVYEFLLDLCIKQEKLL